MIGCIVGSIIMKLKFEYNLFFCMRDYLCLRINENLVWVDIKCFG